ncbi:hypothetical protein BTVI_54096 [Pitangus sulphuratus]|nr:hypothetical protein BTVI_54096 [Pitangus sulphuratus]
MKIATEAWTDNAMGLQIPKRSQDVPNSKFTLLSSQGTGVQIAKPLCFKDNFEFMSVKTPSGEGNLEGKDSVCALGEVGTGNTRDALKYHLAKA